MEAFYYLSFIALFAATLKIVILAQVITRSALTSAFTIITLALIFQNSTEFVGFFTFGTNYAFSYVVMGMVLFSLVLVFATLANLVLTVVEHKHLRLIQKAYFAMVAVIGLLLLNGSIYQGFEISGTSVISEQGPAFPLFLGYCIVTMLFCVYLLWKGILHSDHEIARRSQLTLMAVLPIIIVSAAVPFLRVFGFETSTVYFMPLASTYFVWILMHDERGDFITFKLKWVRVWFFFKLAIKTAISGDDVKIKNLSEQTENMLLIEGMKSCGSNMSATARLLGTSHSSVSRKLKKVRLENRTEKVDYHPAESSH